KLIPDAMMCSRAQACRVAVKVDEPGLLRRRQITLGRRPSRPPDIKTVWIHVPVGSDICGWAYGSVISRWNVGGVQLKELAVLHELLLTFRLIFRFNCHDSLPHCLARRSCSVLIQIFRVQSGGLRLPGVL